MVVHGGETYEAVIDFVHRFGYRISVRSPRRNERLFADISRMTGIGLLDWLELEYWQG